VHWLDQPTRTGRGKQRISRSQQQEFPRAKIWIAGFWLPVKKAYTPQVSGRCRWNSFAKFLGRSSDRPLSFALVDKCCDVLWSEPDHEHEQRQHVHKKFAKLNPPANNIRVLLHWSSQHTGVPGNPPTVKVNSRSTGPLGLSPSLPRGTGREACRRGYFSPLQDLRFER
jgi:hypothetical protein